MSTISTNSYVAVFCGARDGNNPDYIEAASELGAALAMANYGLIYGGSSHGLMGSVARSMHENSGEVVSVITRSLTEIDPGVDFGSKVIVESIGDQKDMMIAAAIAFVAMPGGFGVMDELFQVITLKLIGKHAKPIVVINTNGFFNEIQEHINSSISQGFINKSNRDIVVFCNTPMEAVQVIAEYGELSAC